MPSNRAELVVGVLGGMGPYATLEFYKRLLDNTPAEKDWDHLRILIDSNPKIPSRTRAFLYGETDPVPMMVKSVETLKDAGADIIAIPCNSAHYFLPRVRQSVEFQCIDMVHETAEVVIAAGVRGAGLIAGEVTVKGRLYEQRLDGCGVEVLQVTDAEQVEVRRIIEDAKKNAITGETRRRMKRIIDALVSRGAETVILGCTELPMVVQDLEIPWLLIDSVDVLAKAVVRRVKAPQSEVAISGRDDE
jgi:aspartate racemase